MGLYLKSDDIILVTGMIRSGKSTWLRDHLDKLRKAGIPYLIWDYNWEHLAPTRHGAVAFDLDQLIRCFPFYSFVVYRPRTKTFEHFNQFCEQARKWYNYVLVIEEVEQFATPHTIPPMLKSIIDTGSHHHGIGLICTTRRIMRTNGDITSNASYIVIFKQHRPQDLTYLSQFVGNEVLGLNKMADYSYMVWDGKGIRAYDPL